MRADDVDVPAQQVDARERQVLRAAHDRHQEVPERRRDRRDQEEEDHHDAVQREQLVVQVGRQQVAARRQQLEPDASVANNPPSAKKIVIEMRYSIAIRLWSLREEPRREPVRRVEVTAGVP